MGKNNGMKPNCLKWTIYFQLAFGNTWTFISPTRHLSLIQVLSVHQQWKRGRHARTDCLFIDPYQLSILIAIIWCCWTGLKLILITDIILCREVTGSRQLPCPFMLSGRLKWKRARNGVLKRVGEMRNFQAKGDEQVTCWVAVTAWTRINTSPKAETTTHYSHKLQINIEKFHLVGQNKLLIWPIHS